MFNCFQCGTDTGQKCETCQTPYCSEKCRQANAIDHQVFCHPKLHQRIKSVADYVVDNLHYSSHWCISSGFYGQVTKSDRCVKLSPFGEYRGNGHCMLCGAKPTEKFYTNLTYRQIPFNYCMCTNCDKMKMCPVTFAEVKECARHYGSKKRLVFLMCLKRKYPRVPKDIKWLILVDIVCDHVEK